ncbi:phage virion morphogenesis protein, partial [Enterobacter hormaechei]|nr:phage virion morphogenesis protein [Enterobacter hormaechei]
AVVEFTGKVQRIARIHQYGLKDRPNPHTHVVQYAERKLLGFSSEEKAFLLKCILNIIET